MEKNILFILFTALFLSCNTDSNRKIEINQKQKEAPKANTCKCLDGIGSSKGEKPIQKYSFSNNALAIICGYKENGIISEFELFNCKDGNSITQYNATQNCRIKFQKDTIEIVELKILPSKKWKMELMSISKELIVIKNKTIISLGPKPFFINPNISIAEQNEFLDDIEMNKDNGLLQDWNWEKILAQLEVLSLMENQRAKQILFTIQELTNYKFDGAISEQYKEAIANVEWVKE